VIADSANSMGAAPMSEKSRDIGAGAVLQARTESLPLWTE
jgi:hypothetical protein